MSDIENIVFTACLTLIGGVILLILSELIKITLIYPVHKTREQIQVVMSKVDFYSNRLTNFFPAKPSEFEENIINSIRNDLRESATELRARYTMVPLKRCIAMVRLLPSEDRIETASRSLIFLHNSILYEDRRKHVLNEIEINHNKIDTIHAALTGEPIPEEIDPKERK